MPEERKLEIQILPRTFDMMIWMLPGKCSRSSRQIRCDGIAGDDDVNAVQVHEKMQNAIARTLEPVYWYRWNRNRQCETSNSAPRRMEDVCTRVSFNGDRSFALRLITSWLSFGERWRGVLRRRRSNVIGMITVEGCKCTVGIH